MPGNIRNNEGISSRSEEVQAIIDRMPTHWTKWVTLCVAVLMGVIILLGFVIQYPDTVDGQISITATNAPVRLVANTNGRINLLQTNNAQLQKGDVVSYIESGANYQHILWVDSMLASISSDPSTEAVLPNNMILGEVSSAYNVFLLSYLQWMRVTTSDIYATMRQNIHQQIQSDKIVISNLDDELEVKKKILNTSAHQLRKDSMLYAAKGISEQEYQRQQNAHLSLVESKLSLQSTYQMKYSEIARNQLEIQRLQLEEAETKGKVYSDFVSKKNELSNAINLWKERYLQYAPIDGELEYLGFWRDNNFVQSGQELFAIIPNKNDFLGEVMIPSYGAGKVEVGQTANVKINNYPYDEYGLLKGVVQSVSRTTSKLNTSNGELDAYLVLISFSDGMETNFGKSLPLDFESKGTVEIITKPKRLIERLFDNLKSKREK